MKPSSFSSQYSLYSQVQEAKTASAFSPDSVMSEEEGITKTSVREKLGKQLSPTKTIGALGGGLIGLTGLYMLGQKALDFLFGEASSPSPPSVPPTPVASEVPEVVPTPKKNVVQKATEWGKNSWNEGVDNHNNATQKAKEKVAEVAQTIFEAPGKLVPPVKSYIHAGMRSVRNGVQAKQENAGSAIVRVVQNVVQKPFNAGMNRQERAFTWLEKWLLRFHDATFKPVSEQLAKINAPSVPVEVIPPDPPPKSKGDLGQGVDTVDVEFEDIPKKAGEVVKPHPVTRMRNRIQDGIDAGSKRERDFLDRLAGLWEKIGYNPLEGKWKPKAIKASTDEVIDVVAREIPKKADRATQLAHFVSAFMASSVDIGKENTPELIKKLQKTVPKKVARFKMFKGFKIFKP
jgi:hypothetical protein